jgi:hypothetical protein
MKVQTKDAMEPQYRQVVIDFRRCGLRLPDLRNGALELTPEVSQILARERQL